MIPSMPHSIYVLSEVCVHLKNIYSQLDGLFKRVHSVPGPDTVTAPGSNYTRAGGIFIVSL